MHNRHLDKNICASRWTWFRYDFLGSISSMKLFKARCILLIIQRRRYGMGNTVTHKECTQKVYWLTRITTFFRCVYQLEELIKWMEVIRRVREHWWTCPGKTVKTYKQVQLNVIWLMEMVMEKFSRHYFRANHWDLQKSKLHSQSESVTNFRLLWLTNML